MIAARQTWPADVAARYRARGYWRGETFAGWLQARAERAGDRPAVVGSSSRWTYAELAQRAAALAAGFADLGLQPGERVLVQLPNIPEFVSVVFGLFHAGLVPVFALPAHRRLEIAHFAATAEAAAYVVADEAGGFDYRPLADEVRRLVPTLRHLIVAGEAPAGFTALSSLSAADARAAADVRSSDVALMQLSGGSTGLSKLIPRTHDDYIYSFRASAEICGLDERSVYLCALPAAHNFPMSSPGTFGTLYAGGTVVLSPSPAPDVAFPLIRREQATITALVPPLALVWLDAAATRQDDLASLQVIQVGGARLPVEVARRVRPETGAMLQQVFGMAEGLVNYTRFDDSLEIIETTQGRPISPDDELLIVDDDDRPVAPGDAGHLLTRGPYTIRAYHNAPEANAQAFTPDGYYRTGDIVRQLPSGHLVVLGRAGDQINRGGEKMSPDEIEEHLLAHPQVFDAVVVSVPDKYMGERACAYVVARGERPKAGALKAWIRQRGAAAFKVPDQIVFIDAMPTTGVGKISRRELRALLRDQWQAAHADAGNS